MFEFLKRILPQPMKTVSTSDLEGLLSEGKITLLDVRSPRNTIEGILGRRGICPWTGLGPIMVQRSRQSMSFVNPVCGVSGLVNN